MKNLSTTFFQFLMRIKSLNNLVACIMLLLISLQAQAQVGIGTTTPEASAQLDVSSTNKGILIPRMNRAERDLIATPATGLLIFQTNETPGFYYFNGTVWGPLIAEKSSAIIPFASGGQFNLTTTNTGESGTIAMIGFGASGNTNLGENGIIDPGLSSAYAFSAPRSGTIESISADFIGSYTFLPNGININITAALYISSAFYDVFFPVGAVVNFGSFGNFIQQGSLRKGLTTGLNIPVNAQDRFLLVFSATNSGTPVAAALAGKASAGISIR